MTTRPSDPPTDELAVTDGDQPTGHLVQLSDPHVTGSRSSTTELIDGDQPTGKSVRPGDPYLGDKLKADHAQTARRLAYVIVAVLVGTFVLHYVVVVWLSLTGHSDVAKEVAPLFDKWFPVVTGFAGSAITYFLTRERS